MRYREYIKKNQERINNPHKPFNEVQTNLKICVLNIIDIMTRTIGGDFNKRVESFLDKEIKIIMDKQTKNKK